MYIYKTVYIKCIRYLFDLAPHIISLDIIKPRDSPDSFTSPIEKYNISLMTEEHSRSSKKRLYKYTAIMYSVYII